MGQTFDLFSGYFYYIVAAGDVPGLQFPRRIANVPKATGSSLSIHRSDWEYCQRSKG